MKKRRRNYSKGLRGTQTIGTEVYSIDASGRRIPVQRVYGKAADTDRRRKGRNPKYVYLMELDKDGNVALTKNVITGGLSERMRFGGYFQCEMWDLDKWFKLVAVARRCGIPLTFSPELYASYLSLDRLNMTKPSYFISKTTQGHRKGEKRRTRRVPITPANVRGMQKFPFDYANTATRFYEAQMEEKEEHAKRLLKNHMKITGHRRGKKIPVLKPYEADSSL